MLPSESNLKIIELFLGFLILSGCDTGRRDECVGMKPLAEIMRDPAAVMRAA